MVQQVPYKYYMEHCSYVSYLIGYLVILRAQAWQNPIMVAFKFCFLLGSNRCYYLVEGLACIPGPWADPSTQCIVVCCGPPQWKHWQCSPCPLVEPCACSFFKIQVFRHPRHIQVWICNIIYTERITCIHVGRKIYCRSLMTVTVNLIVCCQCYKLNISDRVWIGLLVCFTFNVLFITFCSVTEVVTTYNGLDVRNYMYVKYSPCPLHVQALVLYNRKH